MKPQGGEESGRRTDPDSGGGIELLEKMLKENSDTVDNVETKENIYYASNANTEFLPYANMLETIDEITTSKKRRTGRRKKTTPSISIIPKYGGGNVLREKDYAREIDKNEKRLGEKKTKKKSEESEDTRLQWYGDPMTFSKEWPNTDERDALRVFHINHNGITYNNEFLEWEMSLAYLMDMQVDVFGITEANLDFNNRIVKDDFIQRAKFFDQNMHMSVSSSLQKVGKSPFKMGGTVTGVNGCWSGRVERGGSDSLGRWSYTSLRTRKGKLINIITFYLPIKPSANKGESTIYAQMELDLLQRKKKLLEPRKELLEDLKKFINDEHEKGNKNILMGDTNDDVGEEDSEIRRFLRETNMEPTYLVRHGEDATMPATHDRGRKCLDMIATTVDLPPGTIKRIGFAPFYTNIYTDHRGIYVDIDIKKLFNSTRPDTTRSIFKRFTTLQIPKCDRYLKKLEELLEETKMFQIIDKLEQDLINTSKKEDGSLPQLITRCKTLFEKVSQLMLCSERQSGPLPYRDGFPDSPELRKAAFKVVRLKKYLRLLSIGILEGDDEEIRRAEEDLKSSMLNLRAAQKSSHMLRQEFLGDLAEKRSRQWKMSTAEALDIIRESEKSKKMHQKHRRFMKPGNMGTLRSLLIPAPITGVVNNVKDPKTYLEIGDSDIMFDVLLRRNFNHLLLSKSSMFSKGPILDKCGWYGEESGITDLLSGALDCEELGKAYPEFGLEGVEFLKMLRYETDETGKKRVPFEWSFGVAEYKEVFNHTKEETACGPSGLHMSHWKAACERDRIARIHSFFIWAAFEYGFTYKRWESSWHCMIQKLQQPFLPKLRIVQLFEGDFNAGLKYLIGRKLMRHMNDNGSHDPETYGSRSGKTAPEALLNLQLLFDHCRMWHKPVGCIFNDAIGCYDRIVPVLCEMSMIKKGCPTGIAKCHTLTQKHMKHKIRISTGISKGTIQFAKESNTKMDRSHISLIEGKTGGIGQGGGGGPMAWISVINIMIETYRKLRKGATITDILNIKDLMSWIVSYVDDNTLVQTFGEESDTGKMIKDMTINLGSWQRLLQLTGGDIDLEKSQWSLLSWSYDGYWGLPKIQSNIQAKGELEMSSPIATYKRSERLHRLEPNEADRVLGVRLPLDGTMDVEYRHRLQQMKDFARKLSTAPLSHYDAYIVYESRYRAMIRYPLEVTQFTPKQCHNLQRPVIDALLPKMGLNRKMPRVVIYGPLALGGREIMDVRIEQIISQWDMTRGHLCREDRAGRGLQLTLQDHQCIVGSDGLFLNEDPNKYRHGQGNTRWNYLWKCLWENNLKVEFYDAWTPVSNRKNDRNIMETAVQDPILGNSRWELLDHVNKCRLYLQVFHLSDLSRDGLTVDKGFLDGSKTYKNKELNIPTIRKPTRAQWQVWKSFLHRNFLSPGVTINPKLGEASRDECRPLRRRGTEIEQIMSLYGSEGGLAEILGLFPVELRSMIGEVTIPGDDGLKLSESIVEGECIGASDGSLMQDFYGVRGGFGYVVCQRNKDEGNVSGIGISPMMDEMSSQTTEHQGLIGLLCILHAVSIKYRLNKDECWGEVTIVIDNRNVVTRAEKAQEPFKISDYQVSDQDLWAITTELIKNLPIRIRCEWVKGHSDTNKYGDTIHGPFWRETQLNIWTDKLASEGLRRSEIRSIPRLVFSTTRAILKNQEGVSVQNLRKYLLRTTNGEDLLDYYRKKKGWHSRVFSQIDWEALENLLRRANPIKKNRHIQTMHDWKNVGHQKGLIRDARLNKQVDPPIQATVEETTIHMCPLGCGEMEDQFHFVKCQAPTAIVEREKFRKSVLDRLKRLRTNECICSYIGFIIKKISLGKEINLSDNEYTTEEERVLLPALLGQSTIGWEEMIKGFAHKGWAVAQSRHYRRLGLNSKLYSDKRWKRMFLTALTDYSNECWNFRNEAIHGSSTIIGREMRKSKLVDQVKYLYKKKNELRGSPLRRIFHMQLSRRIKLGIQSLTLWIGKAEEVLKLHREEADKNTIDRWLGCR